MEGFGMFSVFSGMGSSAVFIGVNCVEGFGGYLSLSGVVGRGLKPFGNFFPLWEKDFSLPPLPPC